MSSSTDYRTVLSSPAHRLFVTLALALLLPLLWPGNALALQPIQVLVDDVDDVDGLASNRWAELSPDGRNVYVAGQDENALAVFARHPFSGALEQIQILFDDTDGVDGLGGVSSIAVSRDGRNVYTAATFEAAVGVFDRDPDSGMLSFQQVLRQGEDLPSGLDFVVWVRVSPDGANVYTGAFFGNAVVTFERDRSDGHLTALQILEDGVDGQDHLAGVFPIVLDRAGRFVYVGAFFDNAISVYRRDPTTGTLSRVQVLENGLDGVEGLSLVRGLAVSGSGRTLFACSVGDNALVTFDRQASTGMLSPRHILRDDEDGVDGLAGCSYIAESRNGRTLFTAGLLDDAVGIFRLRHPHRRPVFVKALRVDGPGLTGPLTVQPSRSGRHLYANGFFDSSLTVLRIRP